MQPDRVTTVWGPAEPFAGSKSTRVVRRAYAFSRFARNGWELIDMGKTLRLGRNRGAMNDVGLEKRVGEYRWLHVSRKNWLVPR